MRTLGRGSVGARVLARGSYEYCHCSQCPELSPVLNEQQGPDSPVWWLGDRVSLALGLGGPQSPALGRQAPWDAPLVSPPRFRISPQEAQIPELKAVQ